MGLSKRIGTILAGVVILVSGVLPGLGFAGAPGVADRGTYLSEFVDLAKVPWPKNRRLTVVCHGHSVPAGYFKTPEVRTFDAYPMLLHEALAAAYPHAVINVIVTAIGGENSRQGAARFEQDVLSLKPDVVTIDYALNDRGISLVEAKAAWASMIEKCLARSVKVVLLTPTPDLGAKLGDAKDPLNQNAEQVRALAAEYHVGLVDSLKGFEDAVAAGRPLAGLMAQGNHPNRAGHEIVARLLGEWFVLR